MSNQTATTASTTVCNNCGKAGTGAYCSGCGQKLPAKRISMSSIVHEIFHLFTHFDKGFLFTLKQLTLAPGRMQKAYLDGKRVPYQKPFSMFFICATLGALALYWINQLLIQYFGAGDTAEASFFHKYWVLLQVALLPLYALINFLLFKKAGYNYAEMVVFQLYVFSFLFLMLVAIALLKFINPHLQTRYIELPAAVLYTLITNLRFFNKIKTWQLVLLSLLSIAVNFTLATTVQDWLVQKTG